MNIMLKLVNIKKSNGFIEANYIPESSKEIGYIKVDIQSMEIKEFILTSYDELLRTYQGHARWALLKLANQVTLPERYPVAWY